MEADIRPTGEHLKELYRAATVFKQEQPWKWLYDADIICVENPKDKTMAYCSVMGKGGEHFALGAYLGTDGLAGFCDLMKNSNNIPWHQALHYQNCLMCSFEDRDLLSVEDRKQIKELGLSFRGRNAWPMFRRFEPGFNPWYINDDECVFLTRALNQTLFVAKNLLSGQLKMNMEQGETIVMYSEEKDGELKWFTKETQIPYPVFTYDPVIISDELLIHKIKKAGNMQNVSLQMDVCYMPSAVQEKKGERPYFPRIFIVAEKNSGLVLDYFVYRNIREDADVSVNRLIDLCLQNGVPQEIQVRSEAMIAMLGDLCKKTGIRLKKANHLSIIDNILDDMAEQF